MAEPGDQASNTIGGGNQFGPVLQGRDFEVTIRPAVAVPVALAQLPPPVAGFTGRDAELEALASFLEPGSGTDAVVVSAVAGLAGVGKTALAVAAGYLARKRGWYPGGTLFIDLHGYDEIPVTPGQALDALLRALGVSGEHIPAGTEARAALYRSVLSQINEPVLVVADNASSEAQVRPLLPGAGPHRVVATSRHTLAGLQARLLDLTVLDQAEGVALLDAALRAARPGDERISCSAADAARLVTACGGLPLALQITASLLKSDPALTAAEMAARLQARQEQLQQLRYDEGSGASTLSVAAAFDLSYSQLDGQSARLFRLLPVNPGADISTAAAAVLADLPPELAREILAGLAHAHLVERAAASRGRWRMHDLVHLYARRLCDQEAEATDREQARDNLLAYYLFMAQAADDHLRAVPGADVPDAFAGGADALAWLDAERHCLVASVVMASQTGRDQIAMQLPIVLAEYFDWRWLLDDRLATATISVRTAHRLGDRDREAAALNSAGIALREMGRSDEAIAAHTKSIAICQETDDRPGEAKALNNLGIALHVAGRLDEAVVRYEDAAAVCRETRDRRGEGNAVNNLGLALREVGRLDEAVVTCQDAAAIFRQTRHPRGEGNATNNLGLALWEVGRVDEAITAHRDAAACYRDAGDRHGEDRAFSNLTVALEDLGRLDEAIAAHEQRVAIWRDSGDQFREGSALNGLANALRGAERFDEAIVAYQDAVAIFRETGNSHNEAIVLNNLASALRESGRFDEAIARHQEAAAIYRRTRDQRGEGEVLNSLGIALREAGRFDESIVAHQDAVAIFRETGDQQEEGSALNCLGLALREAGRSDEATTKCQAAVSILRETSDRYGEGCALVSLGLALRDAGRFDEAIAAHQDAVALFRDIGDEHGEGVALKNLEDDQAAQLR